MLAENSLEQTKVVSHQRSYGKAMLRVKNERGKTRIADLHQEGCAKLRLPTSRIEAIQAVMINSSGGITGGDRLEWSFGLEAGTALTLTTQACERVYAASADVARTTVRINVGEGAKLAWLPQETILFNQGAFSRKLEIDLADNAELLLVEPLVFGRKAMNEAVQNGFFKDTWRVNRNGRLFHAEDALFEGDISEQLERLPVTKGHVAVATILLVAPRAEGLLEEARAVIEGAGGVSFWNGKLLARIMAKDSYHLRQILAPLIQLINQDAPLPKIWAL